MLRKLLFTWRNHILKLIFSARQYESFMIWIFNKLAYQINNRLGKMHDSIISIKWMHSMEKPSINLIPIFQLIVFWKLFLRLIHFLFEGLKQLSFHCYRRMIHLWIKPPSFRYFAIHSQAEVILGIGWPDVCWTRAPTFGRWTLRLSCHHDTSTCGTYHVGADKRGP